MKKIEKVKKLIKKKLNGGRLIELNAPKKNKNNKSNIIFFFNLYKFFD